MNIIKCLQVVPALVAVFLGVAVTEAQAAKAPLIFNTGEDIFVAGDGSIPAPFNDAPELAGAKAGYKCEIMGVLWAYVSISNCKPVVFKDDTFWDDAELVAAVAAAHPEATKQVGPWAAYGKFPLGLVLFGGLGLAAFRKFAGGR